MFELSKNDELPDIEDDNSGSVTSVISNNLNTDTMDDNKVSATEKHASAAQSNNNGQHTIKTSCRSNAKPQRTDKCTNGTKGDLNSDNLSERC